VRNQNKLILATILLVYISLVIAAGSIQYTLIELHYARTRGLYPTPQQAVIANAYHWFRGVKDVKFDRSGPNSFDGSDPHVWYLVYTVYADSLADGSRLYHGTYQRGGGFYLHIKSSLLGPGGWVQMPEGLFPQYIGFWMKVLGIAG
jgi:hypothetical protein